MTEISKGSIPLSQDALYEKFETGHWKKRLEAIQPLRGDPKTITADNWRTTVKIRRIVYRDGLKRSAILTEMLRDGAYTHTIMMLADIQIYTYNGIPLSGSLPKRLV